MCIREPIHLSTNSKGNSVDGFVLTELVIMEVLAEYEIIKNKNNNTVLRFTFSFIQF